MAIVQSSSRKIYRLLGESIRSRRKKARLSQEQLAEKADLTRNYIGDIERAEKKITLETLAKIAKALKCRIRELTWDI
jgi:transcriptional regulator with XRE-family HTH domain